MQPITVRYLRVVSVSDPAADPYGQHGFSALTAYVDAEDAVLVHQLRRAADDGALVVVRCATIEVEGHITKPITADAARHAIAISVEDLRYFKPHRDVVMERRKLPIRKKPDASR